MLVGLCFLVATFTFAIGSALILTIVAIGGYFLTSRTRWNASVLPVYAVSVAAGLILSCALWWLVPRNVSVLGLIGYPVFLVGTVLAMFNLIHITHGAGMLALVPGGLFEWSSPSGSSPKDSPPCASHDDPAEAKICHQ